MTLISPYRGVPSISFGNHSESNKPAGPATEPSTTETPSPAVTPKSGRIRKLIGTTLVGGLALLGGVSLLVNRHQHPNNDPIAQMATEAPESVVSSQIAPPPAEHPGAAFEGVPAGENPVNVPWHTAEDLVANQKQMDTLRGKDMTLKRMTFHHQYLPSKEFQAALPNDFDNDFAPFKALFPDDYKGSMYIGQTWQAEDPNQMLVKFILVGPDQKSTAALHDALTELIRKNDNITHNMPTFNVKGLLSATTPPAQVVRTRSDKDTYPTYLVQINDIKDITFDSMLHGK